LLTIQRFNDLTNLVFETLLPQRINACELRQLRMRPRQAKPKWTVQAQRPQKWARRGASRMPNPESTPAG
jgi:hypothetical protein